MPDLPITTPSNMVETLGSTAGLKACVPIPRILKEEVEGPELACTLSVGIRVANSAAFLICALRIALPDSNDTPTATSCRFCSRFCAVTMSSSSKGRSPVVGV